jgi:hypothetical protein
LQFLHVNSAVACRGVATIVACTVGYVAIQTVRPNNSGVLFVGPRAAFSAVDLVGVY